VCEGAHRAEMMWLLDERQSLLLALVHSTTTTTSLVQLQAKTRGEADHKATEISRGKTCLS